MQLHEFSDKEIAGRMVNYITRVTLLMQRIEPYLNTYKKCIDKDLILIEYKTLKNSIKEDAHWLDLQRNDYKDGSLLQTSFRWTIPEVSAWGFTAPTNSSINYKLYNSLAEAQYKLKKHLSLEEWKKLSSK